MLAAFCCCGKADLIVIIRVLYALRVVQSVRKIYYITISVYKYMIGSAKHFDTVASQASQRLAIFAAVAALQPLQCGGGLEKSNYYTLATD